MWIYERDRKWYRYTTYFDGNLFTNNSDEENSALIHIENIAENCEDDCQIEEENGTEYCEIKNFTEALKYAKQLNTFFVNTADNEELKFISMVN